jgi:hypothetical protein
MEEEEVPHNAEIQFLHFWPKPRCVMMPNRYGQLTESKTLDMYNLMNMAEVFFCGGEK